MPPAASLSERASSLLNALRPAPLAVDARERLRVLLGAGLGVLLMVLTGMLDWQFAFAPAALNSLLLVLAGMAYNTLTGRRYPHAQSAPAAAQGATLAPPRLGDAGLDAVLARYNQVLDVPRDDLAELLAYRNRLAALRCADIMSSPVVTVEFGTPLAEAWALLFSDSGHHHLPIVGEQARLVGILTQSDLVKALSHGP